MKCLVCLLRGMDLNGNKGDAVTQINGTAVCAKHAKQTVKLGRFDRDPVLRTQEMIDRVGEEVLNRRAESAERARAAARRG